MPCLHTHFWSNLCLFIRESGGFQTVQMKKLSLNKHFNYYEYFHGWWGQMGYVIWSVRLGSLERQSGVFVVSWNGNISLQRSEALQSNGSMVDLSLPGPLRVTRAKQLEYCTHWSVGPSPPTDQFRENINSHRRYNRSVTEQNETEGQTHSVI